MTADKRIKQSRQRENADAHGEQRLGSEWHVNFQVEARLLRSAAFGWITCRNRWRSIRLPPPVGADAAESQSHTILISNVSIDGWDSRERVIEGVIGIWMNSWISSSMYFIELLIQLKETLYELIQIHKYSEHLYSEVPIKFQSRPLKSARTFTAVAARSVY